MHKVREEKIVLSITCLTVVCVRSRKKKVLLILFFMVELNGQLAEEMKEKKQTRSSRRVVERCEGVKV